MEITEQTGILIIDDSPGKITMLKTILSGMSLDIVSVNSGTDGLRKLLRQDFACIILDVKMPVMDGLETAELIRQRPKSSGTPILFISDINITKMDILKGYATGAIDYIIPPYIPEIIRSKVGTFVELFEKKIYLKKQSEELDSANHKLSESAVQLMQLNAEINRANEELKSLNAGKDKFFSILAHDLKGPFQGFLGLTEMMAEDITSIPQDELSEMAHEMHITAKNLFALLNNLLEWARMQQGAISFEPVETDLSETVSRNIDLISPRGKQKGIEIIHEADHNQTVHADKAMLNAVLRNLLSNAVKFTKQGGKVSVSYKEAINNMVEISVADSGIGMPEALSGKLFNVAEKVGRRGTDGESSTGLGLLLCKEFVEKHGGSIRVKSEEEDLSAGKHGGSTITFSLPAGSKEIMLSD
ncbi:MAG: hybrid sensor histidine kinase/response regulator [Ignavibacteria bacterium]